MQPNGDQTAARAVNLPTNPCRMPHLILMAYAPSKAAHTAQPIIWRSCKRFQNLSVPGTEARRLEPLSDLKL